MQGSDSHPLPLLFHKIHFLLSRRVKFGQGVFVCGNTAELGLWDPSKAYRLKWTEVLHFLLRMTSGVAPFCSEQIYPKQLNINMLLLTGKTQQRRQLSGKSERTTDALISLPLGPSLSAVR